MRIVAKIWMVFIFQIGSAFGIAELDEIVCEVSTSAQNSVFLTVQNVDAGLQLRVDNPLTGEQTFGTVVIEEQGFFPAPYKSNNFHFSIQGHEMRSMFLIIPNTKTLVPGESYYAWVHTVESEGEYVSKGECGVLAK